MFSSTTCSIRRTILPVALVCIAILCCACAYAEPLFKRSEPVPSDAIVLFDGKDLSPFVMCGSGQAPTWKIENGYCEVKDGDICTKQQFRDCQLHVEFRVPLMADAKGQGRGNSGVFFMGFTYEIQILDSYGLNSQNNDCGSVYSVTAPLVNACRPPEQWQTYDMVFHAPKFDADGKKIANARVTVLQNGVLVQDNTEIPFTTPGHSLDEPKGAGPIELQFHNCPVRFRNVWVRPLPEAK